jgi:hypothetical protein
MLDNALCKAVNLLERAFVVAIFNEIAPSSVLGSAGGKIGHTFRVFFAEVALDNFSNMVFT